MHIRMERINICSKSCMQWFSTVNTGLLTQKLFEQEFEELGWK
jgi:hypothetical protein